MRQNNVHPLHGPGFTLFELLLVLALMAIMVSMAAPSLAGFGRGRNPDYAAVRFVALTHFARSQAISDGATYRLCIDSISRRWWLESQKQGKFEAYEMSGLPYTLPEGVSMSTTAPAVDGYPAIVFEPTGRTTTGNVVISGTRNDSITIECKNPAGYYMVQSAEAR